MSDATSTGPGAQVDVDADAGHLRADQPADLGVVGRHAHQHHAVDVPVPAPVQVGLVDETVTGPPGHEQQQVVAAVAGGLLQPVDHLVEERVLEVGLVAAGLEEHAGDV